MCHHYDREKLTSSEATGEEEHAEETPAESTLDEDHAPAAEDDESLAPTADD